jgi:hypothetical protein
MSFSAKFNQVTLWQRVLLEKLISTQSRNFPTFMNPKVHYIHKSLALVSVLSQMNPVPTLSL